MRLAYWSPLPPEHSGIADYSAELVPRLAAAAEVEVFADGASTPAPLAGLPIHRPSDWERRATAAPFDAVVYQVGNSAPHHEATLARLLLTPGVIVLHEYVVHHMLRELTLVRGRFDAYAEELRYAAGTFASAAALRQVERGLPVDSWRFPLFERLVDRSLGVLVHSEFTRQRILRSRPAARVGVVPFPCSAVERPPGDALAARARLGLPPQAPIVASFGFVTPQKHLEPALAAFARLRRERPQALFLIAGEVSPYYDLDRPLIAAGGEGVRLLGRVEAERFEELMLACDVAVNLRHPTGGETSATLLQLLGLGKPVVVTDAGAFAEFPDDAVVKVAVDEAEVEILAALLGGLLDDPGLRQAIGSKARSHAVARHAPDATARAYLDFLDAVRSQPPPVAPPAPPLAPAPPEAVEIALAVSIAHELADLGLADRDAELEEAVARAFVELDLDRPGGRRPFGRS